jgi:trehalose-phosphatase
MQGLSHLIDALSQRLESRKRLLLMLDYDGTLTPIVSRPQDAILSESTRNLIVRLSRLENIKIFIISGRSLKEIRKLVGITNIGYVGNHGFELKLPGRKPRLFYTKKDIKNICKVKKWFYKQIGKIPGIILEDKGPILAIHYRRAGKKVGEKIKELASASAEVISRFNIVYGKKVVELRPRKDYNKGAIVSMFKKCVNNKTVLVYIGDDKTDEDAFKVLGKDDFAVFVGRSSEHSWARHFLRDSRSVRKFLEKLSDIFKRIWLKSFSSAHH